MSVDNPSQLQPLLPWHQSLWQRLYEQHQQQRMPHALLLCGEAGWGKRSLALTLGQMLLCQQPQTQSPHPFPVACGQCKSCLLNAQGTHPDLVEITPEAEGKPIKVDQIRALVDTITSSAQQGGYRVVVLGPAEEMNVNAANALLKVLEEPGDKTLFALYSHLPGRVMATIRSRCQALTLNRPGADAALSWLQQRLQSLELEKPLDPVELLGLAGGSPLLAQRLIDNDDAEQRKRLYQALKLIATGQSSASSAVEGLSKIKLIDLISWWLAVLQDVIRFQPTQQSDRIKNQSAQQLVIGLSKRLPMQQLFEFTDRIQQYRHYLISRNNPNERLLLEDLLIEWGRLVHTNHTA